MVIIGENHDTQDGLRYVYHNRDYLCNPENNVVILTETYTVGSTNEDILKIGNRPIFSALIKEGATIKGIEVASSAALVYKYALLESRVNNAHSEKELGSLLYELKNEFWSDFGEVSDAVRVSDKESVSVIFDSYDGKHAKPVLKASLYEINYILRRILSSELSARCSLNPELAYAIEEAGEHYRNVLIIVGLDHLFDTEHVQGIKTLLNKANEEANKEVAQAYCVNNSDEFTWCADDLNQQFLCLPGNLYPFNDHMTAYGSLANNQFSSHHKSRRCVLF